MNKLVRTGDLHKKPESNAARDAVVHIHNDRVSIKVFGPDGSGGRAGVDFDLCTGCASTVREYTKAAPKPKPDLEKAAAASGMRDRYPAGGTVPGAGNGVRQPR